MTPPPEFATGRALLRELVSRCAFLHDDWTDAEGAAGWGQYTTNPLLLSPPVCITSPLDGYGEQTIAHLRALGAFGGTIIQPTWTSNNLAHNLRYDPAAFTTLRREVTAHHLHLSTFYNEPERGIEEIARALSSDAHRVRVYPSRLAFLDTYDKLHFDRFTRDVPTPQGALCATWDEIVAFAHSERHYPGLVVKLGHRDLFHLDDASGLAAIREHLTFPLRAETAYPLVASPIVHAVKLDGVCAPLFIIDQYVRDWLHWGNGSPASGTPAQRTAMIAHTLRIGEALEGYEGVYGVDFILTPDDGVYAVDINSRFCTSTYPYALLTGAGYEPDSTHTRFRLVRCRLDSLDDLTTDPAFTALTPDSGRGVFLYCPVSYRQYPHPVCYLNYVVAAPTEAECLALEAELLALIDRRSVAIGGAQWAIQTFV